VINLVKLKNIVIGLLMSWYYMSDANEEREDVLLE